MLLKLGAHRQIMLIYLAEPYSNKDQVAYAMNNAVCGCLATWSSAVLYNFDFRAFAHA